jgi:hypothetical protein
VEFDMKRDSQPATLPPRVDRGGLRPGHLLMLGVLSGVAAAVFVTRDSGAVNMVSVAVAVATSGLVAAGVYRSLVPLTSADAGEHTEIVGGRTRAAIDRERMLVLRSIKELEFDRAMRKISTSDYQEMVTRLRSRVLGLMRQLEGAGTYRAQIERDLAELVGTATRQAWTADAGAGSEPETTVRTIPCVTCAVANEPDARFCKACGSRLGASS